MPDIFETGDYSDAVVLVLQNGDRVHVAWLGRTLGRACSAILLPRMPVTLEEQNWMWNVLTTNLVPGASIRFVGPSLHAMSTRKVAPREILSKQGPVGAYLNYDA
jgi:hypothetical protein